MPTINKLTDAIMTNNGENILTPESSNLLNAIKKPKVEKKSSKAKSTTKRSNLTKPTTPITDNDKALLRNKIKLSKKSENFDEESTIASNQKTINGQTPLFTEFTKIVSPSIEFEEFHTIYYQLLEAFAKGRVKKLIVTMPPQHGKSLGATTLLPAYMLGLNPDLRIAIASYSASLASKFNRRIQRILESKEYNEIFPGTTIKIGAKPPNYIRTSEEVEIVNHQGSLLSVGREGALTGNRVDCFILDDLYKDAMEANSPLVRENCLEWYTSVVKTRMHNSSSELIVFTRWHEEDLIGTLTQREPFVTFTSFDQIDQITDKQWLYLNFEAIKTTPPSFIDRREIGEALWPSQQSLELLNQKRSLDTLRFECMYQGNPSTKEGLLYGDNFEEYEKLPEVIIRRENYTDTADMGDDYLCSICYVMGRDSLIYITDVAYTREPMEVSEPLVAKMLIQEGTSRAIIESNNGGRGFARAVQQLAPEVKVEWFHQNANKQARILSNSATVLHRLRWPQMWQQRWPELAAHLTTYRRNYRANRWHDAADVITGVVERNTSSGNSRTITKFL
ncbi:MAG: phage terminase large subunit [Rikenellaceae bacterium]